MKPIQSDNPRLKETLYIAAGIALLAVLGGVAIPIGPIPIVLQNLVVVLIGGLYGSRLGIYTLLIFLVLGGLGMPIFSGYSGGLHVLLGPTGGFLFSYPIAALLAGWGISEETPKTWDFFTVLSAFAIMFIGGVPWLKLSLGLSWTEAFALGCLPYLPTGIFKAILGTAIIQHEKKRFRSLLKQ